MCVCVCVFVKEREREREREREKEVDNVCVCERERERERTPHPMNGMNYIRQNCVTVCVKAPCSISVNKICHSLLIKHEMLHITWQRPFLILIKPFPFKHSVSLNVWRTCPLVSFQTSMTIQTNFTPLRYLFDNQRTVVWFIVFNEEDIEIICIWWFVFVIWEKG